MGRKQGENEKLIVMSNFSISHQCFKKTCTADRQKQGFVWERLGQCSFKWKVAVCFILGNFSISAGVCNSLLQTCRAQRNSKQLQMTIGICGSNGGICL